MPETPPDHITVILRVLDVLEVGLLGGARPSESSGQMERTALAMDRLGKLAEEATSLEVNYVDRRTYVGGNLTHGDSVGGDKAGHDIVKQSAGGDQVGVGGGHSRASGAKGVSPNALEALVGELDSLASDIARSDLSAREKHSLQTSFYWLVERAPVPTPPPAPEVESAMGPLRVAADWVKERIGKIAAAAVGGATAHWLVVALNALAG